MADPIQITSLRGGVNEFDPPSAILPDQCVTAENVEFFASTLGEKRGGTTNVTLGTITSTLKMTPFLFRHIPADDETAAELFALYTPTDGTQSYSLQRKTTAWTTITDPVSNDTIDVTNGRLYQVRAVSLHGKMFLAYKSTNSAVRLHVWDGSTLRRVGIIQPAAPSVANTGAGSFSGVRYYRVRYTVQSSGVTIRRSEPSTATTFTPSGSGSAARITKPAATGAFEGETHWEVEASTNNADFYRIATVAVGTTTYDDSVSAYTVGYAANGTLSDDVGDYTPPWSARFLAKDQDRLLIGGDWENTAQASVVAWTPVSNDPGVGNDERIPVDTDNQLNLDGLDGGGLTGLTNAVNGYIFAFKLSRIYKLTRTGQRTQAYDSICLTQSIGALQDSVVEAVDASGNPAIYFWDPKVGPMQIGMNGLQRCGLDIQPTVKLVNRSAAKAIHGVFYPDKHQLHYWIAINGVSSPNQKVVLQINQQRPGDGGLRGGWSKWSSGNSVSALSSCMFSDNIDANTTRSLNLVPFVGVAETGGGTDRNLVQRCDTGVLDRGTAYSASITTKPFFSGGLLQKFGIMAGTLLAKAASGASVSVKTVRDFGIESTQVDGVDLTPAGTETQVIRPIDNLTAAECYAVQFSFGDLASASTVGWQVNGLMAKERDEETQ